MARQFHPKVITANDLLEGDVVYLTPEGQWTRKHSEAALADTEVRAQELLKSAESRGSEIVGVYLADAKVDASGRPQPVHFREIYRTRGPSNYFHGKQSEV